MKTFIKGYSSTQSRITLKEKLLFPMYDIHFMQTDKMTGSYSNIPG